MTDLTTSLGTLPPALIAAKTKAKPGQTHPGPRLVIDGLEVPLPAHATVTTERGPLSGRVLTIEVPFVEFEVHQDYKGPTPRNLVSFATAVTTMTDTFHQKVALMRNRAALQPDPIAKMQLESFIDGLVEAMTRLNAVVTEHLG